MESIQQETKWTSRSALKLLVRWRQPQDKRFVPDGLDSLAWKWCSYVCFRRAGINMYLWKRATRFHLGSWFSLCKCNRGLPVCFVETREYCLTESFEATCDDDEAIEITMAQFGRIGMGRCVTRNYGYLGCSKVHNCTILSHQRKKCGHKSCPLFSFVIRRRQHGVHQGHATILALERTLRRKQTRSKKTNFCPLFCFSSLFCR